MVVGKEDEKRKEIKKKEELWLQFIHPKTKPTTRHSRTTKLHTWLTILILSPERLKICKAIIK